MNELDFRDERRVATLVSSDSEPELAEEEMERGQDPNPGGWRVENQNKVIADTESVALFSQSDLNDFQSQWSNLQAGFVDDPRRAVSEADKLVVAVTQRLTNGFATERARLEKQWDRGEDVTTEEMRVALQRYRSFFGRLLKV